MELSADAQAALEMAMNSDLWFSGPRMKVQVLELMCQFANQKSDGIRKAYEMVDAENAELRLQVSALTQALETQKRENQPYIKELEEKRHFYKENYEYMQGKYSAVCVSLNNSRDLLRRTAKQQRIPEGLQDEINEFLAKKDINASGSDTGEQ